MMLLLRQTTDDVKWLHVILMIISAFVGFVKLTPSLFWKCERPQILQLWRSYYFSGILRDSRLFLGIAISCLSVKVFPVLHPAWLILGNDTGSEETFEEGSLLNIHRRLKVTLKALSSHGDRYSSTSKASFFFLLYSLSLCSYVGINIDLSATG